ncbi:MAG: hypothetical protein QOE61_685 [Micromonosporaceae bacterium]|nr:hypothetical protein [Micromonosporaceae bacterium]
MSNKPIDNPQPTEPHNPATSERQDLAAQGSATPMFSAQQVTDAVNRAAADFLDAVDAGDEGLRDAMNRMVNATVAYLTGQAQDLTAVIQQGYDADYPTVLTWIEVAVR